MIKYRKITVIALVADMISKYRKTDIQGADTIPIYPYRRYIDDIFDSSTRLHPK